MRLRKKKIKRKEKEKEGNLQCFALKPEHGPRGIWRKPLKPGALNLHWLGVADLVFTTGWMGGVWQVVGARVSKSFRVQGETFRVCGRKILMA